MYIAVYILSIYLSIRKYVYIKYVCKLDHDGNRYRFMLSYNENKNNKVILFEEKTKVWLVIFNPSVLNNRMCDYSYC